MRIVLFAMLGIELFSVCNILKGSVPQALRMLILVSVDVFLKDVSLDLIFSLFDAVAIF
jgi:hypothetical protein